MSIYHLRLLIGKSTRYAWRRRICRCCPKVLFELFIPIACIILLCVLRWIHTPTSTTNELHQLNIQSSGINIAPLKVVSEKESIEVFNYKSIYRCPGLSIPIEVNDEKLLKRFKRLCPKSNFISLSPQQSYGHILLNQSVSQYRFTYRCRYDNQNWCLNTSSLNLKQDPLAIEHRSSLFCQHIHMKESNKILKSYLAVESLLNRPKQQSYLSVSTWPCPSYLSDPMFGRESRFVLIILFILIDGCILFSFMYLLQELIYEKSQGIIELLRLLSIKPYLNSLSWFLRVYTLQIVINIFLIFILKISFSGGTYLPYISILFLILTIMLWTIHALSQSMLLAHYFNTILRASIWSWFIYLISFWLATTSSIRLPLIFRLVISACLPFYSIKRILILLIQINVDLGRRTYLTYEIVFIWISILLGIGLTWLLALYIQPIRPGKYGIAGSWLWPLDHIRHKRKHKKIKRNSLNNPMIEMPFDDNITVRINDLTKTFGRNNIDRQIAVDHISFKLERSTIYGLIGPNGSGKTTSMEMLCGLLSCDCGKIEIHNKNLFENLQELQTCIGYCPQDDMLFSYLTVKEQLEFYARIRLKTNNINYEQIDELLNMMDMKTSQNKLCHTLSGGMKRKLSILCALIGNIDIIILDEPFSSLDPVARHLLWRWLQKHKTNRTFLISSHLLDEIEELCDSIIVLDSGQIRAQGSILELKQEYYPLGDRILMNKIPSYVPNEFIIDENKHLIQIPDRKTLINILELLEKDNIEYSIVNTTLDDVFVKLISSELVAEDENVMKSEINQIFSSRTSKKSIDLWYRQILAVIIRRSQVFLKQARLLPFVLLVYILYALTPLYMPSFSSQLSERPHYIISSASGIIDRLNLNLFDKNIVSYFNSSQEFQHYLSKLSAWPSKSQRKMIGIRMNSSIHFECYVPTPILSNTITYCLPIYSIFSNRSMSSLELIGNERKNVPTSTIPHSTIREDSIFFCLYTLPPTLHVSFFLISIVLIICAAFAIQDNISGLHSYSLTHGLNSFLCWIIIYVTDLILCLFWLLIIVLISRFVHSSTFNGQFFLLMPLFFFVNLPFIYLIATFFKTPVLGATAIIFILQLAYVINSLKMFIDLFRGYRLLSLLIHVIRWFVLIIFPNVNIFTLIVSIQRKYLCKLDGFLMKEDDNEFSHENYPYKILIHIIIMFIQFIVYFSLLIIIDVWKIPLFKRRENAEIHVEQNTEDNDVQQERKRVNSMNNEDRRNQSVIVDKITKYFRHSDGPIVNQLTFSVPHRQCFGLLGFNGSGKTTTFRILIGELLPNSGHVYKSKQESIGYCPQHDISFTALTVIQSINYICRLHGLDPKSISDLILKQFQLERFRHRLVSNLSGGTQRRLHLALSLVGSPSLLLLDEPTAKVDPFLRNHIRFFLQNRPNNTSIIFSSHSMLECEQLCDRLTILVRGNQQCIGSCEYLKNKYGINYRIRLKLLQSSFNIASILEMNNNNEYIYPKGNLASLFKTLEDLVEQNIIERNYTVQLTSLEQIFLKFQYSINI